MKILKILFLLLFLTACLSTNQNQPKSAYEQLTKNEQNRVDAILEELKKHHLFFLPELSRMDNLIASTARAEEDHDHSANDLTFQDEHLDIKITQAYPDKDGKFHTPILSLIPTKTYTYETLYTISIVDNKTITVTASKVEENQPKRVPTKPDEDFIKDLAVRLKGEATSHGVILLP